jgi:hypothetical protein
VQGLAHKAATALQAQGYNVVSVGDAPAENYVSTTIEYGPTRVDSSHTVKESIPGSIRQADPTEGDTITVIIGSDYTSVVPVTLGTRSATPSPSPTQSIQSFSAATKGCLS